MKKVWLTMCATATLLVALIIGANAVSAESYGKLTYTVSNGEVTITDCDGWVNNIEVPSEIGIYPVTRIGERAFQGCGYLEWITLPDSLTSIESCAFSGCDSLSYIPIPDNVTSIGSYAFSNCDSFDFVEIPDSVTSIGECAFQSCDNLTDVTIGNGVTSIGEYAFLDCLKLTHIKVGGGNPQYASKDWVLFNKAKTTLIQYPTGRTGSYTIPDGVTSIEVLAFADCARLSSLTIPNSVKNIRRRAFYGCNSLGTVWYTGSQTDKSRISMKEAGSELTSATWHYVDGNCDTTCNQCEATRTVAYFHTYTNNCDTTCNVCSAIRTITHAYDNACDTICNVCSATRTIMHTYTNTCDAICNVCSTIRTITHTYSGNCDPICDVCSATRTTSVAHTYTNNCDTDCNVCAGTRTITHTYSGNCDTICNVCSASRTTTTAHAYTNTCDTSCNNCNTMRTIQHTYDNACDTKCNVCSKTRTIQHTYSGGCDSICNVCKKTRTVSAAHTYSGTSDCLCNVCSYGRMPVAPVSSTVLARSITLRTVSGCEYSKDGVNWQSSTTFDGLKPNTSYTFYQRVKQSGETKQSKASPSLKVTTKKEYTVTFNANGGSAAPAVQRKTYGVSLTLTTSVPTRSGHVFLGWSTTPNGEIEYAKGGKYTKNASVTLYAKWACSCTDCGGDGKVSDYRDEYGTCSTCKGKKYIQDYYSSSKICILCGSTSNRYVPGINMGSIVTSAAYVCNNCGESQVRNGYKCRTCNGNGRGWNTVQYTVSCDGCDGTGNLTAPQGRAPKPTKLKVTENSVQLVAVDGVEYSMNGVTWQPSNIFYGLRLYGTYTFYQRYAANSVNSVGPASEALYVTVAPEIKITTQPKHTYAQEGATAKVTVKAMGDGLKYQWYIKNDGASKYSKSSVTSSTYSVKMSDTVHNRRLYCVVTDQYGNKVQTQTVILRRQASITTQLKSSQTKNGATAKVTVGAKGDGLKYTWYIKNAGQTKYSKSSVTSSTYSVKMSSTVKDRYVYCVVTDKYGKTVKTNTVVLRMAASIITQPKTTTVKNGATAKVTVKAAGDGLKYTWYIKNAGDSKYSKSSITSSTYSVKMSKTVKNRYLYCVVTDKYGKTVKTNTVQLKMK